MTDPAIRLEGLTRDFGALRAVDQLCFEVPRGSIFGFLGPNGAGKTTTIQLLLGLLEPSAGRAEVLGRDTRSEGHAIRERVGALLEHHGLYEQLSAQENLELYARIWRLDPGRRRVRVQELLEPLGLWERRAERVGTWSRGMKQKLALARALLHRPPLVFLDEPTAGLDVLAAATVREELEQLAAQEGLTVFLTTHNMAEAERLCDRVAVVRDGSLLALGHPDELRGRSGNQLEVSGAGFGGELLERLGAQPGVAGVELSDGRLRLELVDGAEAAPLVSLIVSSGARIEEVQRGRASLEEVFLTLVREESSEEQPT